MTCKKRRYRDRVAALMALGSAQRPKRKSGDWKRQEARTYRCASCKGWHLTSWAGA